ncbi:MAG: FG-GAP-like repeat-containing protein [Phycisphaerales bacterium]
MAVSLVASAANAQGPLSEPFPPVLDAADLHAGLGVRLPGPVAGERLGIAVGGAVDLNGDGLDDLLIGADFASPSGRDLAGSTYVVFGDPGLPAVFDVASLDGSNGVRIDGADTFDQSGSAVAGAGDVNGDGFGDIVVGAPWAYARGAPYGGEAAIVFGRDGGFDPTFDIGSIDGVNGFVVRGWDFYERTGRAVSGAGDFNGDGLDDVAVGSPDVYYFSGTRDGGEAYVVFGRDGAFPSANPLRGLGTQGLRLNGQIDRGKCGDGLAGVGDVNGDGIDDVLVGSSGTSRAYLLFGRDDGGLPFSLNADDLDGSNGVTLVGARSHVSGADDFDGDGVNDFLVARGGGPAWIVFGSRDGFPAQINLDGPTAGVATRLEGSPVTSVAGVGDVNGDGAPDVAITGSADTAYVVYGTTSSGTRPESIALPDLDGVEGFVIRGGGDAVAAAGDVNGDGAADIVLGNGEASPDGRNRAGSAVVIYGRRSCRADFDGDGELTLFDFLAFQNAFDAGEDRADFDGDGELTLFDFLAFQNAFDAGCR